MSTYGELGTFSLKDCISTIAFSPNGDYFAAGGLDESLFVWNAIFEPLDKKIILQKQGHSLGITDIKFSNRGANVAVCSMDSTIRNWDIDTNGFIDIEADMMGNWKMEFIDRTIYAAGNLGKIGVYDSISGQKSQQIKTQDVFINSITYNNTNNLLAVGNTLGAVFTLPKQSTTTTKYQLHYKPIRGLCFTDDGTKLLTCSDDYSIRIFDINAEAPIAQLNGHKNAVTCIHYNPIDKTIASGGLDKLVKMWDIRTKTSVGSIGSHTAPVWALKYSNNGKVIVSGGQSGILAIHSIK